MKNLRQNLKYIISDCIAAIIAWTIFYSFRKIIIESGTFGHEVGLTFDKQYYIALFIIPVFWFILHVLSGYYNKTIYQKSRLYELGITILMTSIGATTLFFLFLLDDWVSTYKDYYYMYYTLLALQFVITYIPRLVFSTLEVINIQNSKIFEKAIIIGSRHNAVDLLKEVEKRKTIFGLKFIGFVYVDKKEKYILEEYLPKLGHLSNIKEIILAYKVEQVIIAIESNEHSKLNNIINKLHGTKVSIKIIPDMYDILIGKVRMSSIFDLPLIEIKKNVMPMWQELAKRYIDISVSIFVLTFFSPLYLIMSIGVKMSSKGPILFSQERVGKDEKPFMIYKFRSMYIDSEKDGPALSTKDDDRITKFGKFIRKVRLDEIPQFYNVLIGDMSLVGPRPERRFYIDQIVEKNPNYIHLLSVRPGITSWGQVKFGYAQNVDEMAERLKYDIIYIENRSLFVDLKILIHTIKVILKRKGI